MPPELLSMLLGSLGKSGGGASGIGDTPGAGSAGGGMPAMDVMKNLPSSLFSVGVGALQGLQANKLKKQADASMPPLMDANQLSYLSELNQKRKSIETGADFAAGMNALNSSNAGTNDAIIRNSGGDVNGTIQALLQSQRSTNDAKNNLLAQGAGEQMQYNSMYGDFLNKITARKLQLQMYKSQQARAEWAAKQKDSSANLMAGATRLLGGGQNQQNNPGMSSGNGEQGPDLSVLQNILSKTAGMNGAGMTTPGEGVEGGTNIAADLA